VPAPTQVISLLVAAGLGIAFALSFYAQVRLQRLAANGESSATLFKRITMAGSSFAILFGAVLVAKLSAELPHEAFMLVFFISAALTFIIRWRSNRTLERDARKSGARPSP